jgi:hypothetical protein
MEPRPQRPRQPQGGHPQQPGNPSGAGSPPSQSQGPIPLPDQDPHGYPQGYEPGGYTAPPRTDYDYSPLDLAPPGQRRRRQIIAGVIGALAVILIGVLIVSGWMLLRDDDPDDNGNLVAVATESPVVNEGAAGDAPADSTPASDAAPT